MLKFVNGILVIAVLVSASALYNLEHKTRGLERQIAKTKATINDNDEAIKLLNAEWSSLTRPERIQALAEQNLKMVPRKADQIVGDRQKLAPSKHKSRPATEIASQAK